MLTGLLHFIQDNVLSACLIALFFGGSIFVHELGHFLAARRMGLHVERFSIGFGPPIVSWRGKDGVDYRLAWFPLGGYVLLPQLADLGAIEGRSETDAAKLPQVAYWPKMFVFVAGAVFNVLFAFALACIIWVVGQPESTSYTTTKIGYVAKTLQTEAGKTIPSPAAQAGLRVGDIIRRIDGQEVHNWSDVSSLIMLSGGRSPSGAPEEHFLIERDGRPLAVTVYPRLTGEEHSRQVGIDAVMTPIVDQIHPGSAADKAGFRPDDLIRSVDGRPVESPQGFVDFLRGDEGREARVEVERAGKPVLIAFAPTAQSAGNIFGFISFLSPTQMAHPSPLSQVWSQAVLTFRTLASLLNPHSDVGLSKMSGVIGIVHVYHEEAQAGLRPIIILTILINVNLAMINLLPIPVLDGGQMLFATIGWIRGRGLPTRFVMATQSIFMMLILLVMVYIGYFDVLRWTRG